MRPHLLILVVNERLGGGCAGRMLSKVARRLREQAPIAELHIISSNSQTETEKLTCTVALETRPGDVLLVMGGDGMAYLGLSTAAGAEATPGLIPAGTGNDSTRGVGVPRAADEAVRVIVAGRTCTVDLAHISNNTFPRCYVGVVVSTGYDARVNHSTNHIRSRLGAFSYGCIALRELVSFSLLYYDMIVDGVCRRQEAMLVAVSNTGIFGGGTRIVLEADLTDGLLDVTVAGPVSRITLLRLLPSMYSGALIKHPCVEQFSARNIELTGEGLFVVGDGEELGEVPVRVECVSGVFKVFAA